MAHFLWESNRSVSSAPVDRWCCPNRAENVLISESPVGNYRRRKTPGLCLVEALPGEVVALGISMCDTTRDGSRIVDNQEVIRFLPDCSSSIPNLTCAKTS